MLITDFEDCSNCEQLGARALDLAIQVETLRAAIHDVVERN